MPIDIASVKSQLQQAKLPDAEGIAALAEEVCRVVAKREPLSRLPIGASRFGGTPDVPDGFAWPIYRDRSLTFLAQFDLSEVQLGTLPNAGWLLFFYDVAEQPMGFDPLHRGGARVIYFDVPREALSRTPHPDVTFAGGPFESCVLSFEKSVELPLSFDPLLKEKSQQFSPTHLAQYDALLARFRDPTLNEPYHHFFGHPQFLQGNMREECQLVTNGIYCGIPTSDNDEKEKALLPHAKEWRLLLQLDNDADGPDWLWGENGRLYFWIQQTDLDARRFENAWLIRQSE